MGGRGEAKVVLWSCCGRGRDVDTCALAGLPCFARPHVHCTCTSLCLAFVSLSAAGAGLPRSCTRHMRCVLPLLNHEPLLHHLQLSPRPPPVQLKLVFHEVLHHGGRSQAWHYAGTLLGLRHYSGGSAGGGSAGYGANGRRR